MTRIPTRSILGSLKGRIWFAVSGLAVLNCIVGIAIFLLSSAFIDDARLSVFLTFLVVGFVTMAFGGWLSNDVLEPLNKLNLAAKSLERSPTASLPRTTGALETDELLDGVQRSCSQIQELITAMDQISAGRVHAVQNNPRSYDRLGASFQNLVNKVADSVNARTSLDALEKEIVAASASLVRIRNGEFDAELRTEHPALRGYTETLNFLAGTLRDVLYTVRESYEQTEASANAAAEALRDAQAADGARAKRVQRSVASLSEIPGRIEAGFRDLGTAFDSVSQLPGIVESQHTCAQELKNEIQSMRERLEGMSRSLTAIRDRSAVIPTAARVSSDISKRLGLVSVNLSLGTDATSDPGGVITRETDQLAGRSKALASAADEADGAISRDLAAVDSTVASLRTDISSAGMKIADIAAVFHEVGRSLAYLLEFREKLASISRGGGSTSINDAVAAVNADLASIASLLEPAEAETKRIAAIASEIATTLPAVRGTASAHRSSASHLSNGQQAAQTDPLPQTNGNGAALEA